MNVHVPGEGIEVRLWLFVVSIEILDLTGIRLGICVVLLHCGLPRLFCGDWGLFCIQIHGQARLIELHFN
jgi:hypothetical protein